MATGLCQKKSDFEGKGQTRDGLPMMLMKISNFEEKLE